MGDFPKCITYILAYFSLYNFYNTPTEKKLFHNLKLCIHISLAAWCTFNALASFVALMRLMERLDVLNFIIYYMSYSLTFWLIIYESNKHSDPQKFWHLLIQINEQYFSQAQFKPKCYLIILILMPFIDIGFTLLAYFNEPVTPAVQKFMSFIFLQVTFNRLLFYLFHLKVIKFQLQKIQIELINIKNSCRFNVNDIRPILNIECIKLMKMRFKWIRNYYGFVYDMSKSMNSQFGWSQLAYILLTFQSCVTFLNFFYRQMNRKFVGFNYG